MIPEKSAGEQMRDAFGTSCKGLETLPHITVLNKWLLEKFGVEVPENVAGKPIVLRDGSGKHTENFYHLGACGLNAERIHEVMAQAKENRLEMANAQQSSEQGNAFIKLLGTAMKGHQVHRTETEAIQVAAASHVPIYAEETTKGRFNFRKTDAHPGKTTDADLIANALNKIVNAPDGRIFIPSKDDPNQGWYVNKNGNTITSGKDGLTGNNFSFQYAVNSDNSISVSNFEGKLATGIPTPKSAKIWFTSEGELQFKAEYSPLHSINPAAVKSHNHMLLNGIERE